MSDWIYARKTHEMKLKGGPEQYEKSIYNSGYAQGQKDTAAIAVAVSITAVIITNGVSLACTKWKEHKEKKAAANIEKCKTELQAQEDTAELTETTENTPEEPSTEDTASEEESQTE